MPERVSTQPGGKTGRAHCWPRRAALVAVLPAARFLRLPAPAAAPATCAGPGRAPAAARRAPRGAGVGVVVGGGPPGGFVALRAPARAGVAAVGVWAGAGPAGRGVPAPRRIGVLGALVTGAASF